MNCHAMIAIAIFATACGASEDAIVSKEHVFAAAPFPSCHASTLAQVANGEIVAAWFGGSSEGSKDVGIWSARRKRSEWSAPTQLAKHSQPCWNPVLHYDAESGQLLLFYKAGPSPQTWSGFLKRSVDGGTTWSASEKLPAGILGPVRSKPLALKDGSLLCGSSVESFEAWGCYCEITTDLGKTWAKGSPINLADTLNGVIQPTIVRSDENTLRMFMRTRGQGSIATATSLDEGRTWSAASLTNLPNPNAGVDAVRLKDGRIALIYNDTPSGRQRLALAVSSDGGANFGEPILLEHEPGNEFSYPAIIELQNGQLGITYTWKRRRIAFAVVDPLHVR